MKYYVCMYILTNFLHVFRMSVIIAVKRVGVCVQQVNTKPASFSLSHFTMILPKKNQQGRERERSHSVLTLASNALIYFNVTRVTL